MMDKPEAKSASPESALQKRSADHVGESNKCDISSEQNSVWEKYPGHATERRRTWFKQMLLGMWG